MQITKRTNILAVVLIAVIGWAIPKIHESSNQVVTFEEAKQVWDGSDINGNGLTYQEVVDIVGDEGIICEEESPPSRDTVNSTCYAWINPDQKGWMKADFVEGHLVYVRIDSALIPGV